MNKFLLLLFFLLFPVCFSEDQTPSFESLNQNTVAESVTSSAPLSQTFTRTSEQVLNLRKLFEALPLLLDSGNQKGSGICCLPAGEGKDWHHIVEQRLENKFGPEAIHNTKNIVAIPREIHWKISGHYGTKPLGSLQTNRERVGAMSFE